MDPSGCGPAPHLQEDGHGVKAEEPSRSARRQWTPDEEDALRSLVETHAIDQTASVLGRSVAAVRVRASLLGMVWRVGAGWRSAGEVADICGVDVAWITARIDLDRGELQATNPHGRLSGSPMAELCRISGQALRGFLIGHAHELDGSAVDLARVIGIMAVRNPERRKSPLRRQTQANPDPGPAPYRRWTGEERERLRALVETHTIHQAAPVLGRSVTSVRVQASRLGLTWRIREDDLSVREVASMFAVDIRWVMRRINRRSLRAVTPYGRRPGLRQVGWYRVPAQALRVYLIGHSHELRGRRVDLARIASIMAGPEPRRR